LNNRVLNPLAAANEAEYYYPNNQSARFAWYHDHAMGITRLNAYAGVASAYLIRDAFELDLKNYGLPEFIEASVLAGKPIQELPLVVQDKKFVGPHIADTDPAWGHDLGLNTDPGSLWYQHTYDTSLYDLDDPQGGNLPGDQLEPSVVPEFFGDTMLVNGTAYPRVPVEPRRYRLRILNACNARFLNLQLYMADGSPDGITLDASGRPTAAPFVDGEQNRPAILQIGTEGGFLPKPVLVPTNMPFTPTSPVAGMLAAMSGRRPHGRGHRVPLQPRMLDTSLLLAPAERADLIVDFSKCGGKHVVLYNDAPSPFPMGDPIYDFFPGLNPGDNPANAVASPGFGPNTRVLMRFEVAPLASGRDVPLRINTRSNLQPGIDPLIVPVGVTQPPPGVRVRRLTLNEGFDEHGRLLQLLGTNVERPVGSNFYGLGYMERATEVVRAGATEVWEIYNLTGDVHPMHFHLVNAQLINRQIFDTFVAGVASFAGAPEGPELNERGWKETVKAYPSTVTRIALKFDVPGITKTPRPDQNGRMSAGGTVAVPSSPRTGGAEYVWHCHILEHEEHDMMRPLILT
jgi:spore coat protein A